ncbi:hypothetical protein BDQ12DRAFT_673200 [Crucibulum laeve]|uniref:Uncharacterized protein n=1 Tax=Crucibulum laeve TaxID=68775 RepID=A0A5C3MIQ6_9AGAR|nr:hypothetical protein BDQ12DRAFT_673200 [Crucibulum laeve]
MFPFEGDIPALFDPVLDYLSETLPSPLYSFLINLVSHCMTLFAALFNLFTSLISTNPLQWDAQTVLPPLISVLAAYLALASLYRTTSWMIRTSVWFIKWGTIIGALTAGAGWYMGSTQGNGVGGYGIVSSIGGLLLDMINGKGQNAAGGSRANSQSRIPRSRSSRSKTTSQKKPKPWDTFESHRQWQYQERAQGNGDATDIQKIINDIVETATNLFGETSWWGSAKSVFDGATGSTNGHQNEETDTRQQPPRKAKSRSSSSRSR